MLCPALDFYVASGIYRWRGRVTSNSSESLAPLKGAELCTDPSNYRCQALSLRLSIFGEFVTAFDLWSEMLTVEPSLDDLLDTTSISSPFPQTRKVLQCGWDQSFCSSGDFIHLISYVPSCCST